MWHTLLMNGDVSCGLCTRRAGRWRCRANASRENIVGIIREEQLVARRVVADSTDVGIILAGSDERLLREAANELQARGG